MKSSAFRFALLLVLVLAVAHFTAGYCPPENCVPDDQCDSPVRNVRCENGNRCCSIVKTEYRTHCNHYGGICMDNCSDKIWQRGAVDCAENQRCCVLV
ncbi:hypothetical protein KPH14_009780 [Odynerus spinipes]|uniref:Carboxypeptidase inhibitor n=1 Tax=Odynerus spinipes TaxID=1348599 RepID=A0AAD9RVS6_9HYME|nr:hypothetical protein KPH14_009780 [Odynerus spinipes]